MRLTLLVALVILAWTALDLTNSALCALEQEQFSPSAGDNFAFSISLESEGTVPPIQNHVDDCFCCSHCVTVVDVTPASWQSALARRASVVPVSTPVLRTFPVYHPPQIFA